jgi:F-type H+-transporting ATPase subunit epsilon
MHINVLTPEEEIYKGEIKSVKVPGTTGQFQVLQNHAPIVSSLEAGKVYIREEEGAMISFNIEKGFIEVLNNRVSLLVQGISDSTVPASGE